MNKKENTVILAGILGWLYQYSFFDQNSFNTELNANTADLVDLALLSKLLSNDKSDDDHSYKVIYNKALRMAGKTFETYDMSRKSILPLRSVFDHVEIGQSFCEKSYYQLKD